MKAIKRSYSERKPRDYWVRYFDEFQTSELSMSEYSRKNNLVNSQFSYWYSKLKKELNQAAGHNLSDQSNFIAVKIVPDKAASAELTSPSDILCTLEFDGNKRLYLHTVAAIENVIKLLLR